MNPSQALTEDQIELRWKANRFASYLFNTAVRLPLAFSVGGAYWAAQAAGFAVLPMKKWLASPFEHRWDENIQTLALVYGLYLLVILLSSEIMSTFFGANKRFRTLFGYERDIQHLHVE